MGEIDTSLLLDELIRKYRASGNPLEITFRSFVGWVRPGDQLTHLIHPYPAKLLPHIAHFFTHSKALRGNSGPVLDPFAGSGTVALEASMAGAMSFVADANPLALLITKVKTTPYDVTALVDTAAQLRRRVSRIRSAPQIDVVNDRIWYYPNTKTQLERVLRAIGEVDDDDIGDFFRICFSVTARRLSRADPTISVPVQLKPKPTLTASRNRAIKSRLRDVRDASVSDEFAKVVHVNIARVLAANIEFPNRQQCISLGSDARNLRASTGSSLADNSIPLTITSPPYGSAQKYIRANSLSLNWLSMCAPKELAQMEASIIGREHFSVKRVKAEAPLSRSPDFDIACNLSEIHARNPQRAVITETYLTELGQALREIARITTKGGAAVIVVGNNTVCGYPVKNDEFITAVMQNCGMRLELALRDRILSRGLLTSRNFPSSVIQRETILLFRK